MNQEPDKHKKHAMREGILYSVAAFAAWGLLTIYWKTIRSVSPGEILANRIVWSCLFLVILLLIQKRIAIGPMLGNKHSLITLIFTSLLIGTNWFLYIYAVSVNRILEASMGYYINPLVNVLLGIIFLREKLKPLQIAAFAAAATGVLYMTIDYGQIPILSLGMAFTFGIYGLLKKTAGLESLPSLFVETLFLAPVALGYLIYLAATGHMLFLNGAPALTDMLLVASGAVTALPLYWFAQGTKKIPLSTVGFIQYISPTTMLILGITLYGEHFTRSHMVSFGLIWVGLACYSITLVRDFKK